MLNWLKVIPYVFRKLLDEMERLQKMSGGRISGQIVFWTIFLLSVAILLVILSIALQPAFDSVGNVLTTYFRVTETKINIPSSLFPQLLLALLLTTMYMLLLFGLAVIIGAFLGVFLNLAFAPFITYRIDKIFTQLLPVINKTRELNPNNVSVKQLQEEAHILSERWNKSKLNRFTRFITTKRTKDKFDKTKL